MILGSSDWESLWLSLKLAIITTVILVVISIPLAIWLTFKQQRYKTVISSFLTLPIILPPTVLGFYLLVLFGPNGFIGRLCSFWGIKQLTFTFTGLVFASVIYSLPFVVLPIQNTFSAIGKSCLEVSATLGAKPLDSIINVLLPQAKVGIVSAAVIGFAHTIGEFGIVLMLGGNIPGKTQVASIQIYNHFEAYEYGQANYLAIVMLGFSFIVLLLIFVLNHRFNQLLVKENALSKI